MHSTPNPLFHHDIRWPNVIRASDNLLKWFLIDWDEAASPPTRAATHLERSCHAPEVLNDCHGGEVDVWGVGHLIKESSHWILGLSDNIVQLGEWMQTRGSERPDASAALKAIRALQWNMNKQ